MRTQFLKKQFLYNKIPAVADRTVLVVSDLQGHPRSLMSC